MTNNTEDKIVPLDLYDKPFFSFGWNDEGDSAIFRNEDEYLEYLLGYMLNCLDGIEDLADNWKLKAAIRSGLIHQSDEKFGGLNQYYKLLLKYDDIEITKWVDLVCEDCKDELFSDGYYVQFDGEGKNILQKGFLKMGGNQKKFDLDF